MNLHEQLAVDIFFADGGVDDLSDKTRAELLEIAGAELQGLAPLVVDALELILTQRR